MSVKKFLVLSAAGVAALAAAAAQAGGPDVMAAPAPAGDSGIYVDVDAGWVQSNWSNFWGGGLNTAPMVAGGRGTGSVTSNARSGFTWGGDLGYQFNRHFSAELGWYKLPTAAGSQGLVIPMAGFAGLQIRSWALYFAGKISVPVYDDIDLFGKAGLAWRNLSYSGTSMSLPGVTNILGRTGHYWAPFLGFGGQWWITPEWSVNVQYLHIPAYTRNANVGMAVGVDIKNQAPSANLVVGGVGYKFAV